MRSTFIVLAICSLSLSGCGTAVGQLVDQKGDDFYLGVQLDAAAAGAGGPLAVAAVADLPLSAVADTILVPSVVYHKLSNLRSSHVWSSGPTPAGPICPPQPLPRE
jgi:uncharacterized protein YceK